MKNKSKKKNLVILAGLGHNLDTYQQLCALAPRGWRIFGLDLTKLMPDGISNSANQTLRNFIESQKLTNIYLLGHSTGGALALQFAHQYPKLIDHLFLVDSEGIYDQKPLRTSAFRLLSMNLRPGKKAFRQNLRGGLRVLRRPLLHLKYGRFAHFVDLQKEAKELKVPTTLVWGEKDLLIPPIQGQKLHSLIPKSKFILIPNVDHDWIIHTPSLFWKLFD